MTSSFEAENASELVAQTKKVRSVLLVGAISLAVSGCSTTTDSDSSRDTATGSSLPVSSNPTVSATPVDLSPLRPADDPDDPCQLVTATEVGQIVGEPVVSANVEMSYGQMCSYTSTTGKNPISIHIQPAGGTINFIPKVNFDSSVRAEQSSGSFRRVADVGVDAFCSEVRFEALTKTAYISVLDFRQFLGPSGNRNVCAERQTMTEIAVVRRGD